MKLIGYTLGLTKREQDKQKEVLQARFPGAKVYSESCSRNGKTGKPTRQTRGHALMALDAGDVLVTDKLERIATDGAELAAISFSLLAQDVHLVAIDDDIDTRNDTHFRDFMAKKLAGMKISKKEAVAILEDAKSRGKGTLRNTFTADEEDMIRNLLALGIRTGEIAQLFLVSEAVVNRTRSAHGWTTGIYRQKTRVRSPEEHDLIAAARARVEEYLTAKAKADGDAAAAKAANAPVQLTPEDDGKIRDLIEQGIPPKDIAPLFRVNVTTIRAACRRMGLGVDKRFKNGVAGRKVTADIRPELLRRRKAGESVKTMASELGVPKERISRALVIERGLRGEKGTRNGSPQ